MEISSKTPSKAVPKACLFHAVVDVPHHCSQKNDKEIRINWKTGKRYPGTSARVQRVKDALLLGLRQRAIELRFRKPIAHRVYCVLFFGYPPEQFYTKDLKERLTLGDCTNLAEAVQDALEKAGIVENDFYIIPYHYDRVVSDRYCVMIELWDAS